MITTLTIIASITFLSMMSPGPDMFLILKNCSSKSSLPALKCILGICAGVAVHVSFSILGIAAIIATSAKIYTAIKLIGAAYLIFIGIKSLRYSKAVALSVGDEQGNTNAPFRDGLLCNLLNPKVTIFILAVFTQVIDVSSSHIEKMLYGGFIVCEAFIVWYLFSQVIRTKIILSFIEKFQVSINRITGIALIGFGGALAFSKE